MMLWTRSPILKTLCSSVRLSQGSMSGCVYDATASSITVYYTEASALYVLLPGVKRETPWAVKAHARAGSYGINLGDWREFGSRVLQEDIVPLPTTTIYPRRRITRHNPPDR